LSYFNYQQLCFFLFAVKFTFHHLLLILLAHQSFFDSLRFLPYLPVHQGLVLLIMVHLCVNYHHFAALLLPPSPLPGQSCETQQYQLYQPLVPPVLHFSF